MPFLNKELNLQAWRLFILVGALRKFEKITIFLESKQVSAKAKTIK